MFRVIASNTGIREPRFRGHHEDFDNLSDAEKFAKSLANCKWERFIYIEERTIGNPCAITRTCIKW